MWWNGNGKLDEAKGMKEGEGKMRKKVRRQVRTKMEMK
jgi:hypothetical protein